MAADLHMASEDGTVLTHVRRALGNLAAAAAAQRQLPPPSPATSSPRSRPRVGSRASPGAPVPGDAHGARGSDDESATALHLLGQCAEVVADLVDGAARRVQPVEAGSQRSEHRARLGGRGIGVEARATTRAALVVALAAGAAVVLTRLPTLLEPARAHDAAHDAGRDA